MNCPNQYQSYVHGNMLKQIITCCCCLKCTYTQHAVQHVTVGSQNITTEDVRAGGFIRYIYSVKVE